MAEVEDISQEEADAMSPADPTQLTGRQMKALLRSKGVRVEGMLEMAELRSLVQQSATRTDVKQFLVQHAREAKAAASAASASSSSSRRASGGASSSSSSSSSSGLTPELTAFAAQMKHQAAAARQNPAQFRSVAPEPFKSYTDEQVRAYADQIERAAADPVQLKRAHAQTMAAQRGGGTSGSGAGGIGQLGAWTDAQLDQFVAEVKRNPTALRAQILVAGRQYGMDETKVDQILGLVKAMDASTLKTLFRVAQRFQGVATKFMAGYAWVDRTTGGYAKILAMIAAAAALYLFYLYLAGPLWYIMTYIPKLLLSWLGLYTWPESGVAGGVAEAGANGEWVAAAASSGGGGAGAAPAADPLRPTSRADLFEDDDFAGGAADVDDEFSEFGEL